VMWPAMLLMWLPSLFMRQQMTTLSVQMATHDYSSLRQMWPLFLLFYAVAFVLIFMQVIGIAQLALDRHKGPVWFYFSLGKPVWRLIGSFLLLIVAIFVGGFAVALAGVLIGILVTLAKAVSITAFGIAINIVAPLAGLWCFIYCLVRLSFLLTPIVAAEEEGFALARSWKLGKGNFWRMFAILLATIGPFVLLELILVMGFMFKGVSFPPPHASAAQTAAYQAAVNAHMLETMNGMHHYWYISFPLMIAIVVVFYGLATAGQCFAYRALTGGDPSAPVAAD
jgi:hypothetical protein